MQKRLRPLIQFALAFVTVFGFCQVAYAATYTETRWTQTDSCFPTTYAQLSGHSTSYPVQDMEVNTQLYINGVRVDWQSSKVVPQTGSVDLVVKGNSSSVKDYYGISYHIFYGSGNTATTQSLKAGCY